MSRLYPLNFLRELARGPSGLLRWRQRMGYVEPTGKPSAVFYCHGVGEIRTALPLLRALHGRSRRLRTVLMVYGRDAFSLADKAHTSLADSVIYCPYYAGKPVAKAFSRLRARCLVVVESDLAPVYVRTARAMGMSVAALSFSLSHWRDRDLHGLSKEDFAAMLEGLDLITFKHRSVKEFFFGGRQLPSRMSITGNLRYAVAGEVPGLADRHLASLFEEARNMTFVFVAGSTYGVEEEMLFKALKDYIAGGRLVLVVAPRKPWKAASALQRARSFGLEAALRSAAAGLSRLPQVMVVDTMGELASIYGFAHAAFVGGTIRDKGGHNIFEPARFGIPVVFGPHYGNNFDFATKLVESGGGQCVATEGEIRGHVRRWLENPALREKQGAMAKQAFSEGVHVLEQTAGAVRELLERAAARG